MTVFLFIRLAEGKLNQHTFLIEVDQIFFHEYLGNINFGSRIDKLYTILNKTENNYKHIEIKYFTSKGFTYSYFTTIVLYLEPELSLKKAIHQLI